MLSSNLYKLFIFSFSASSFRDNSDWKKIGVTDNCQHLSVYLNRPKGVSTDFSMIKVLFQLFFILHI